MAGQEVGDKNHYSITWAVNNFSYCWQKKDEALASPIFNIYTPEETKWKLLIFPRGTFNSSCIAYYLYRAQDDNDAETVEVEYSLEFLTADGSILTKGETKHSFPKDSRWGYPQFQTREKVFINKRMKYLPDDILRTRCRMKLSRRLAENPMEKRDIFARTIINVERKSLLWNIEKFRTLTPDQKKSLTIKSASEEVLMKIDLFLIGGQFSEEKIILNIRCDDRSMKFLTVKTSVLNALEMKLNIGEFESLCEVGKCSTFPLKLSRNELIQDDHYLPNDVLSLNIELATSSGFVFKGVEKIDFGTISHETTNEVLENWQKCNADEKIAKNTGALTTDLISLYKNQSLCDMKLQSKTSVFPVHTSILGARSPVFRAMFSTDMKEKLNGCVDVSDLTDEAVHQLLLYLYTDKLEEIKWEDAFELYKAADKYAIISLVHQCSLILKDNLNLENACRTLIFADLYQDENLKDIAQDFILKNAKEIFKSEKWELLMDTDSKLALETMLCNWREE